MNQVVDFFLPHSLSISMYFSILSLSLCTHMYEIHPVCFYVYLRTDVNMDVTCDMIRCAAICLSLGRSRSTLTGVDG